MTQGPRGTLRTVVPADPEPLNTGPLRKAPRGANPPQGTLEGCQDGPVLTRRPSQCCTCVMSTGHGLLRDTPPGLGPLALVAKEIKWLLATQTC